MNEWVHTALVVFGHSLFWLGQIACLMAIPLGLPGTWGMIALAVAFGLFAGFAKITVWTLLGMTLAAAAGEGIEFLGGLAGARYMGASKWGMMAAMAGGLAGALLGAMIPPPVIGSLIGAFGLCFLATTAVEYLRARNMREAMRAGLGAFLGKVFSTITKISIAMGMAVWMAGRIYFT